MNTPFSPSNDKNQDEQVLLDRPANSTPTNTTNNRSASIHEIKSENSGPQTVKAWPTLLILCIILALLYIIIQFKLYNGKIALNTIHSVIQYVKSIPEPIKSFLLVIILVIYQISFIPTQSSFIILMAFGLQSFSHSMVLLIASVLISGTLTYWTVHFFLKPSIYRNYSSHTLFRIAEEEGSRSPHKINMLLRFLFIPVTFKNLILSCFGKSYLVFISWYVLATFVFGCLYIEIGLYLSTLEDLINPQSFWKKSTPEKIKVILGYCVLIFTVLLILSISCYTKVRLAEMEREDSQERILANNGGRDEDGDDVSTTNQELDL